MIPLCHKCSKRIVDGCELIGCQLDERIKSYDDAIEMCPLIETDHKVAKLRELSAAMDQLAAKIDGGGCWFQQEKSEAIKQFGRIKKEFKKLDRKING